MPGVFTRQSVAWFQIRIFDSCCQRVAVEKEPPWWRLWPTDSPNSHDKLLKHCPNSAWRPSSCWRCGQKERERERDLYCRVCLCVCIFYHVLLHLLKQTLCVLGQEANDNRDPKWPVREHSGLCYCQNVAYICKKHPRRLRWHTHTNMFKLATCNC